MKKTFIALLCMTAGLLSCSNDDNIIDEQTPVGVPMTFNITVDETSTTRAVKADWASGDKIYVFFNGLETKYLVLTYDGSSWTNTSGGGTLLDTDFSGLTTTLTAVHFPVAVDVAYADSKFSFTSGGKPVYNYYLFETGKDYTVDGTTVTASLSMGKPADMAQFHVAGIQAAVSDYTFGCSLIKPVACKSVGTNGTITEDVLQSGARLSGVADADGGIFAGRLMYPETSKYYTFTLASDDNIYTLTRTNKTLTAGKMYNFPATSDANWTVTATSDLYVDLGLPSGTKWAKWNLGASSETNRGKHYAWGLLQPFDNSSDFVWSNYIYGTSYNTLTKYCNDASCGKDGFTDALTTLLPEDDAAYAALGGKFRMPTIAEWEELQATKSNTTDYTWTYYNGSTGNQYNGSTTPGWKIVKNETSATIFIPFNGYSTGSAISGKDSEGNYWSSSLREDRTYSGKIATFTSSNVKTESIVRCNGASIRPVFEPAGPPAPPSGSINGLFSVSSTKQVYFSQGNLQANYDGTDWTWGFAEHQYDYIGNAAGNTSINGDGTVSANGTVDLFGWVGASNTTWTGAAKYGISNSTTNDAATYGNGTTEALRSDWGNTMDADWSNKTGVSTTGWRTLTSEEWKWLLGPFDQLVNPITPTPGSDCRTSSTIGGTENARWLKATVHSVKGLIIFPDVFTWDATSMGDAPTTCNTENDDFTHTLTNAQWTALESAGCVFLPTAGYRNGATVYDAGTEGLYWSSEPYSAYTTIAWLVCFESGYLRPAAGFNRSAGVSVRLVRNVE